MAKVAFLGLGVMGFPWPDTSEKGGHDVTVYNRTREKADKMGRDPRRPRRADAARRRRRRRLRLLLRRQ